MDRVADRDEIRGLIADYTIFGDRGPLEAFVNVFAEDAEMVIPTFRAEGRAGIYKAFGGGGAGSRQPQASAPAPGARGRIVRHHLTTSLITFDGPDDATGRTYWINFTEAGPDHSGLYADKFRRIDGVWKIARREVRLDWKAENSRQPPDMLVGPRPADAPPLPVFRGD